MALSGSERDQLSSAQRLAVEALEACGWSAVFLQGSTALICDGQVCMMALGEGGIVRQCCVTRGGKVKLAPEAF